MSEIKLDSIKLFNEHYGFEHLNPMVTVGHHSGAAQPGTTTYNFGVYAIYIKETKGCKLNYGLTKYDFDEMSVTSFAPGQKVTAVVEDGSETPQWTVLAFHPDFLSRTALGKKMSSYGFFSYNSNEALHLSKEEVGLIQSVLSLIEREMRHATDRHSRNIIISHIEVFGIFRRPSQSLRRIFRGTCQNLVWNQCQRHDSRPYGQCRERVVKRCKSVSNTGKRPSRI